MISNKGSRVIWSSLGQRSPGLLTAVLIYTTTNRPGYTSARYPAYVAVWSNRWPVVLLYRSVTSSPRLPTFDSIRAYVVRLSLGNKRFPFKDYDRIDESCYIPPRASVDVLIPQQERALHTPHRVNTYNGLQTSSRGRHSRMNTQRRHSNLTRTTQWVHGDIMIHFDLVTKSTVGYRPMTGV